MKNTYFQSMEDLQSGQSVSLQELIDNLTYTDKQLIPVITQDATSKEVLMLAWMNRLSLQTTLSTGRMTYWSRSRNQLWLKGETSGHFQYLKSLHIDCDGDALLCLVDQQGAACHTGRDNCFYFEVDRVNSTVSIMGSPA
ncbi:MAG: phosphoribosyl-AMP cyclohydrolase [Porticoccaceae bacterium]